MNQKYQDVDESTLTELLKTRMKEFKSAEKASKPQTELNIIYQDIKEIKHQLTLQKFKLE